MKKEQLLRLAEANDPQGLYELGLLFIKGKTVKTDAQRGMSMIKKSAALGYANAIDLLHDITKQQAADQQKQVLLKHFNMTEVKRAPSLTTVNSIGYRLLGKSNYDAHTQSYETTHFFVCWWIIPLWPTARYRVIRNNTTYRFMGKLPLQFQDWIPAIIFGFIFLLSALLTSLRVI